MKARPAKKRISSRAVTAASLLRRLRKAEQRLRQVEERYEIAMGAINESVYDWDIARGRIVYSESMQRAIGLPPGILKTTQDWWDRIHPDDLSRYRAAFIAHFKGTTERFECDYRYRAADGSWRWCRQHGAALRDSRGRAVRMVGSTGDITQLKEREQELATQKAILETTLENIDQGITMVDRDLRTIAHNRIVLGLLELPPERFAGTFHLEEAFRFNAERGEYGPGDVDELVRRRLELSRRFEPHAFERTRPDGRVIAIRGKPLPGGGFVSTYTDITEFREQEQRLRDQVALTRALIDENPNAMYLKDAQGRYVTVNDAWLRMVGVTRERAIGRNVLELFPEEESKRYYAEDLRLLEQGEGSSEMESLRTGPDGRPQWLIVRKAVLRRADGTVVGLIGTNTDITRLKRYEEDLAIEQRRLDLVVRAAKTGMVDWDGRTRVTYYSPRFREILGYASDADTSGWPDYFKVLIHPDDRERIAARWRAFVTGKGPEGPRGEYYAPEEYRLLRADAGYIWVQVSGIAERDARGFVTRWIAAVADITGRRAQEEALRQSVRLREEVERMSRHDLKTPLNSVIAVSRLLREGGKLAREDEELISIVERAGYRLLNMVNLSLDLFRMEQGNYQFRPQAVDLADVARKAVADLESQAASKNVAVRVEAAQPALARAEELLCYSMLANLLKNAIEAAPEGSVVSVTLQCGPDAVALEIHNEGAVPGAIHAKFFEKYATSGKSGGFGLGTYSARLMARVQEGDITLRSSEARGTTISVRLGAARHPASAAAGGAAPEVHPESASMPELPALRVLMVDDDEFNRLVLRRYLPSPPLTVEAAVNGRAAIEAAGRQWPDVVLLDLEMPVMSGYEAAAKLRKIERTEGHKRCTIVAISSNDDEPTVQRALAAGCDQYLVKPASRQVLWRILAGVSRAALPSGSAPPAEPSAADAVEVDADLEASLPAFLDSRRKALEEMPAALAAGDRVHFKRLAHRLTGSFALYGFRWASAQCHTLERNAADGGAELLAAQVAAVRAHLDSVDIRFVPANGAG